MLLIRAPTLNAAAVLLTCFCAAYPAKSDERKPDEDSVAEVLVTGSRIPTSSADETMPVTVLDATDLTRGGLDSLSKVLQTLPLSASSVPNTNNNNGGVGASRTDLRALEPKRTLVLLNGHRFPNGGIGGDNAVDVDMLPVGLIDRVEILTSGASAIYGADAVAGVINFITKPRIGGLDASAEHSQSDRGDGQISRFTLSGGHEVFGGDWMLGTQWVRQSGVLQSQRAFSAMPESVSDANGNRAFQGSATLPEGVFDVPSGNALGLPPGNYTHITGTEGRAAGDYRSLTPADSFNYAPYQYLQTPNQRASVWLLGTQPLTSNLSLHVEGLFNHRTSSQRLAPTPYSSEVDPTPTLADGSQGIPADDYYNPFGVDLADARRRFVEITARSFNQRVDMNRELASLQLDAGTWRIEPTLSYAHSSAAEIDVGAIAGQRLADALGPSGVDAAGQVVCGTPGVAGIVPTASIIAGCVPVNIFGGVGSVSPQQVAYLGTRFEDHGTNAERIASLDAHGPLGRAWGGPVQWDLGAEYRYESGSYTFDPGRGSGAVGSGGQEDIPVVSFTAREAYLEIRAPLARDLPLARNVDVEMGARYSNFSSFGGHFAWQAGLRWEPVASLALRGNYARVFRAPSLSELYVAQGTSVDQEFDPCGNGPSPAMRVHCAANGVPGGAYTQANGSFLVQQGGNPNLKPESGYNAAVGVEIRPPMLRGLLATVDFYRIDLQGAIENPGDEDVLQQCANGGGTAVCGLIKRNADGTLAEISSIPRNLGDTLVSGVDANLTWIQDVPWGRIKWSLLTSYLLRHDTQLLPGGLSSADAGTYSDIVGALPRWRSLGHLDFSHGPWRLSYSAQWVNGYAECNFVEFQNDPYCRRVSGVLYHDVEAAVTWHSALTFRLGVNNLTNVQPPFLNFGNEANTDSTTYRLLGRTFFAGFRYGMR